MVKCIFCGNEEDAFKGLHLLKNDGSVAYFCSSKCRKNALKLKRDKRKLKWTSAFHEVRAKVNQKAQEAQKPVVEDKPTKKSKK